MFSKRSFKTWNNVFHRMSILSICSVTHHDFFVSPQKDYLPCLICFHGYQFFDHPLGLSPADAPAFNCWPVSNSLQIQLTFKLFWDTWILSDQFTFFHFLSLLLQNNIQSQSNSFFQGQLGVVLTYVACLLGCFGFICLHQLCEQFLNSRSSCMICFWSTIIWLLTHLDVQLIIWHPNKLKIISS